MDESRLEKNRKPTAKLAESRSAEVEAIKLHYLTAGNGPTVILLHGYTQTSRMWRSMIPKLAEKFTAFVGDSFGRSVRFRPFFGKSN